MRHVSSDEFVTVVLYSGSLAGLRLLRTFSQRLDCRVTMSSVEFTLSYSFLAASGSDPVLTAALESGAIYRIRTDECQVGNLMPYPLANIALSGDP
ncbi:hypothetical protein VPHK391_0032 [Vibrio phage K391]